MNQVTLEELRRIYLTDPLVMQLSKMGADRDQILIALADNRKQLLARILELEIIAPKKYIDPDGVTRVWLCPVDLIPVTGGIYTETYTEEEPPKPFSEPSLDAKIYWEGHPEQ